MKLLLLLALTTTSFAQTPMPTIPPTGHVPTPDVSLAYWVYDGPAKHNPATPIIAVNGGPGLSHLYMVQNDVWQRLSAHRQVIFYDQRGTGASPVLKPNAPQTMDAQVADLDAVRAHLHLDKIDLCGDSYGGLLVIAYAAAHPSRVHKLIISDGLASWDSIVHLFPQVFPDILEANETAAKASTATDQEKQQQDLRDHFGMIFYSRTKLATYMANAKDLGYTPDTGEAVGKATEKLDLTAALPKFTFPTLVITGRYDMNVAPLTAWRMAKSIPNAKFVPFEESGHLPSYEEPEKYVQVVDAFLAD
jgi:proline iminopeptidase